MMAAELKLEHVSPATRLLEKRRKMFEINEDLEKKKEEFARLEESFRIRQDKLQRKDMELKESLTKFNKFCQENEAKKNRADKRFEEERQQCAQKDREIAAKLQKLEDQARERRALRVEVDQNIKYQRYLENVVEYVSEDYGEIADILNRHKTLKNANEDLQLRQKSTGVENEQKRAQFNANVKEGTNLILNFNNEIASKQKELEQCEARRILLQSKVDKAVRADSDKTLELGMILMAVQNLVQRCLSKRNGAKKKQRDVVAGGSARATNEDLKAKGEKAQRDLDIIAQYLSDYEEILQQCPKEYKNQDGEPRL